MSRIGNQPIVVPNGVTVDNKSMNVTVTGPKGTLVYRMSDKIKFEMKENNIKFATNFTDKKTKSMHGLMRSLINNAIIGVTQGWSKTLQLVGVGFRGQTDGTKLTLNIGFSHPVEYQAPQGIIFDVKGNDITISGYDKHMVGEVAAQIRRIKPPEVYKGKGIRYKGEQVKLKPGKAAKTATTTK